LPAPYGAISTALLLTGEARAAGYDETLNFTSPQERWDKPVLRQFGAGERIEGRIKNLQKFYVVLRYKSFVVFNKKKINLVL
jgi:hypothetical protein